MNHLHQTMATTAQLGDKLAVLASDADVCARVELSLQPTFPSIPAGLPAAILMVVAKALQTTAIPPKNQHQQYFQKYSDELDCQIDAIDRLINDLTFGPKTYEELEGTQLLLNETKATSSNLDMFLHTFSY